MTHPVCSHCVKFTLKISPSEFENEVVPSIYLEWTEYCPIFKYNPTSFLIENTEKVGSNNMQVQEPQIYKIYQP